MKSTGFGLGDVVQTSYQFSGFVQLDKALEPDYRRACRTAFLPTDVENKIFKAVARAAQGNLDQGRRNLLILSPFGTGKSLDLVMVYDIFSSKGNTDAVKGFDAAVRNEVLGLTSQGPYLVVPVVGTESPKPLSQAILGAFRCAVETHPFLKGVGKAGPFLVQVEYEQAALWLRQIGDGGLGHLGSPVEAFLRSHPAGHTLSSLEQALEASDPTALEIWRSAFQAATGQPPSGFGVATPRDIFDRALPELRARGIVGIALLVDELSQYLRLYPQYEAEAIRTLDPLVHWIHQHEPCFSIVATQAIPERLQEGVTDADYQAWASLLGRFQVLHMDRQRYDALIAKALTRAPNPPTDPDKHPQMQELLEVHATCFSGDDRAKAQRAVAGYYPFHPAVIAAIGAIADSLGQFERSIFQYLDRGVEGAFKNLIDSEPVYLGAAGDRLRLVTLDEIFRFFAQPWSKLEGVNDSFAQASRQAEAAVETELGRRVLDLITLLAFIEGRAALPTPTLDGIASMLNVSRSQELDALLGRFVGEGYFTWDETFGYRLATAGGPRPSEVKNAIQRKISESVQLVTGTTVLQHLRNYQNLASRLRSKPAPVFPIEPSYGITVKNVTKGFEREFMTARQLVDRASSLRPGDTLAGNLLMGVVTSADNANGKQYGQSVTAAKTLAQAGALVALPRQPVDAFTKAVKNYEAAKNVSDDSRLGGSDVAKQALETAQYELLITLSGQYQAERLDWYTPANPTTPVRLSDAAMAVQAAAQKLMEKFPAGIAMPDLVGGSSLEKVIRPLLDGGGPIELRGKPGNVFVSLLQPLGVLVVGPKTKDPKRTITLTEPDPNVSELVASAEISNVIAKALPVGGVVGGEELHDTLKVLQRPPYWCPEDLVVYLLAAYMGKYRVDIKQPYEGSFHRPSVEEAKSLVRRRSNAEVMVPQSIALSTDQTLFVESLAKAVAATLPPGAAAYTARSLDPKALETGLAKVGEDLGRWHRDYGAYASELFSRHGLGPREAGDFLKAMAEAAAGGPDRLKAVRLYTYTLPAALRVPGNQAPLVAEQMIEGLTELGAAREDIDRAPTVAVTDSAVAAAWAKFAPDSLNKEQRQRLLQSLRGAKEKVRPSTPGAPGAPDKTGPAVDGRPGRVAETRVSVHELRTFAEFVLVVAAEVKSGARVVGSLEELVGAYRATPDKGVAGA